MQIPFVGSRIYDSTANSGSYGSYWSSSPYDDAYRARNFVLSPNSLEANGNNLRGVGDAVRCFKNSYQPYTQSFTLSFMSGSTNIWEEI